MSSIREKVIPLAEEMFAASVSNVMSHTIRGIETIVSNKYKVRVSILIKPHEELSKSEADFCMIVPTWHNWEPGNKAETSLTATILIHPNASRCAARFAICHEMLHLLDELEYYENSGRTKTLSRALNETVSYKVLRNRHIKMIKDYEANKKKNVTIPTSMGASHRDELESYASQFAGELCYHHYQFHSTKELRMKFHSIPDDFKTRRSFADIKTWLNNMKDTSINFNEPFTREYSFNELFPGK